MVGASVWLPYSRVRGDPSSKTGEAPVCLYFPSLCFVLFHWPKQITWPTLYLRDGEADLASGWEKRQNHVSAAKYEQISTYYFSSLPPKIKELVACVSNRRASQAVRRGCAKTRVGGGVGRMIDVYLG